MNLEKLRWTVRWAEKFAQARTYADEIAKDLATAKANSDTLGVFIYQSRACYRRTEAADKNKSCRKTESTLRESYKEACRLGFTGSFPMCLLMRKALCCGARA